MRKTSKSITLLRHALARTLPARPHHLLSFPMARPRKKNNATRISISLPVALFDELDEMVAERGYASRSEAISKMISEQLVNHHHQLGKEIMAGTITLTYDHSKPGLQSRLMKIQHKYLKEIISS